MTRKEREEAIKWIKENPFYHKDHKPFNIMLEALEQEPILDKIRAEITDTGAYEQETMGQTAFLNGINYCLGVIDRYKAEILEVNNK